MRDIALLMTGVLTTGQTSPPILPEQPLVALNNSVEKSTRGQLSQLVPTPQITPPEFIQPNGTILSSLSAPTIERNCGVHAWVEDTASSPPHELCGVSSKRFRAKALTTQLLSLTQARVNTATKSSRPQQRPATQITDKPLTIDEQDFDNNMVVKKSQKLNSLSLPNLHFGDSGISVKILQRLLLFNGYAVELDGVFGALTETAIKAFQYRRNLVADGIVGERTWDELTK